MSDLRDKIARALFNKDQNAVSQRAAEWSWSAATASSGGETYWHKAADAVLAAIDLDKVRAEAVREAARYIERITPKGLADRADVIADLTIAADRLESGIHANGRERKADQ